MRCERRSSKYRIAPITWVNTMTMIQISFAFPWAGSWSRRSTSAQIHTTDPRSATRTMNHSTGPIPITDSFHGSDTVSKYRYERGSKRFQRIQQRPWSNPGALLCASPSLLDVHYMLQMWDCKE